MLPSDYLFFGARNGVGVLSVDKVHEGCRSISMTLIGSSMKLTIGSSLEETYGSTRHKSLYFELDPKEDRGVIALRVRIEKIEIPGTRPDIFCANIFIEVQRKNEKIVALMDNQFMPSSGRLIEIEENRRLVLVSGNTAYMNESLYARADTANSRLVDADSLCRYAVGYLSREELEFKSTEKMDAATHEKTISELKEAHCSLERKIRTLEEALSQVEVLRNNAENARREAEEKLAQIETNEAERVAELREITSRMFFPRKRKLTRFMEKHFPLKISDVFI